MAILLGGVLAMTVQSRRLTEGSIGQNFVVSIVQGYLEQMKNMDYVALLTSPAAAGTTREIPTILDETSDDPLILSWGDPPATLPAIGTTPTGAIDNVRSIPIRYPPQTPSDTLSLNVWVWVKDLTGTAANVTNAKAITMIYTYELKDGGRVRYVRNSIRSIRSVVPTY